MKLTAAGRSLLRTLRHTPDRLSHAIRRKKVLQDVERRGWPRTVLFVCHGNICRSPYAATAFARALPEKERRRITITSAGFMGPNRPVPPEGQRVAAGRGLDLSRHRSQLITTEHARNADLIVVMDALQRRRVCLEFGCDPRAVIVLGDLDPYRIERRAIHDPIGQPEEYFEASYARIDRCLAVLVSALVHAAARNPVAWVAPQRA